MKLEQQVASLELSKRLKELGVKQESIFWWTYSIHNNWTLIGAAHTLKPLGYDSPNRYEPDIAAFTVAELGEMLPDNIICGRRKKEYWCQDDHSEYEEGYGPHTEYADTEANARAKMLIHLIEHGIVKPLTGDGV